MQRSTPPTKPRRIRHRMRRPRQLALVILVACMACGESTTPVGPLDAGDAGEGGVDLDLGLSSEGFSVAPGEAVVFSPVEVLPRDVVQRSVWLEIWRPDPARE